MRTIIAGSRDFNDIITMHRVMHDVPWVISQVLSGCAVGADTLGEMWAKEYTNMRQIDSDEIIRIRRHDYESFKDIDHIPIKKYPANWDKYGKRAGIKRNLKMAKHADALVAFWNGTSKGTQHMIQCAMNKNLDVIIYKYLTREIAMDIKNSMV